MSTSVPAQIAEHERPDAEEMKTRVGGSEAFELLNQPGYGRGCARALALRKKGTPEDVARINPTENILKKRAFMHRGQMLEDLINRMYCDLTGRNSIRRNKLIQHPNHPGAAVHVDRVILADDTRPTGDLEIKSHNEGVFYSMLRRGLPATHELQLQWALWCSGHTWGSFAICGVFGELPLKYFDREADPEIHAIFGEAVDKFWATINAGELPPQLENPADMRCRLCPYRLQCRGEMLDPEEYKFFMRDKDRARPLTRIDNAELDEALADRALIMGEIEALTHESETDPGALQLVTARIRELLGEEEAIEVCGRWKVYHSQNSWSGLDQTRLKTEQPEVYEKYYISKRPTGARRLRVYALAEKQS